MSFFPYDFDNISRPMLRLIGVRPDRDGVRIDDDRIVATLGFLNTTIERSNIRSASRTGPYSWIKAVGPRLSIADHGLTFGTNSRAGVCLDFERPIPAVIGPWDHPGMTVTVADPSGLLRELGFD